MSEEIRPLRDVIKEHVLAALEANDGHPAKTAKSLKLATKTVYNMLERWGMREKRERPEKDVTEFLRSKKPSLKRARIKPNKVQGETHAEDPGSGG